MARKVNFCISPSSHMCLRYVWAWAVPEIFYCNFSSTTSWLVAVHHITWAWGENYQVSVYYIRVLTGCFSVCGVCCGSFVEDFNKAHDKRKSLTKQLVLVQTPSVLECTLTCSWKDEDNHKVDDDVIRLIFFMEISTISTWQQWWRLRCLRHCSSSWTCWVCWIHDYK